jgi:hypothetical protein
MPRKRHPDKHIESALKYAEENGWRTETGSGHAWGKIYCPSNSKACRRGLFCISSVWSTPKNAANHAGQIRRVVDH